LRYLPGRSRHPSLTADKVAVTAPSNAEPATVLVCIGDGVFVIGPERIVVATIVPSAGASALGELDSFRSVGCRHGEYARESRRSCKKICEGNHFDGSGGLDCGLSWDKKLCYR
jgi:hypothetical protein